MMIFFMIALSLLISIIVNVLSSCWICYGVVIDTKQHWNTILGVTGVILINAMIPFTLGCMVSLLYI